MKKSPIVSSLYLYNKSKKQNKSDKNHLTTDEHNYKESALSSIAKKSFLLASFLSRKNKN